MGGGRIFISYRRGRDSDSAGRLHDRLERIFGRERLFYDIDSIPPGVDFHRFLNEQVARCDVFLAVIGNGWLEQIERLRDENDYVRIEIAAALRRKYMRVIPVLVQGAAMPARPLLPRPVQPLSRRNAVEVPYAHFAAVVDRHIAPAVTEALAGASPRPGIRDDAAPEEAAMSPPLLEERRPRITISEVGSPPEPLAVAQPKPLGDQASSPPSEEGVPATLKEAARQAGTEIARFEGHTGSVTSIAFAPDGTRLATGSDDDIARVWDLAPGGRIARLEGHGSGITSVAFAPDGTSVATGSSDRTARVWDLATGGEIAGFEGHGDWVTSVAFAPDGTRLATGSWDNTARVWDLTTGGEIARLEGHDGPIASVAFALDGTRLATGSLDKTARVWDLATGQEITRFEGHGVQVTSVAFSPDGTCLADNTARLWDLATKMPRLEIASTDGWVQWALSILAGRQAHITCVAFSPDGTRLATGFDDGTARLWQV